MSSINFTARLVDSPTIQKRNIFFKYNDKDASIIEFDNTSKKDLASLEKTSLEWMDNGARYADAIYYLADSKEKTPSITKHFYALTTQKQNFEKIEPKNILGLMMFYEKENKINEIGLLEVNPTTNKSNNYIRKYKQVGKELVNFIKTNFSTKDIKVMPDYTAINFYKKLGFTQLPVTHGTLLQWKAIK